LIEKITKGLKVEVKIHEKGDLLSFLC